MWNDLRFFWTVGHHLCMRVFVIGVIGLSGCLSKWCTKKPTGLLWLKYFNRIILRIHLMNISQKKLWSDLKNCEWKKTWWNVYCTPFITKFSLWTPFISKFHFADINKEVNVCNWYDACPLTKIKQANLFLEFSFRYISLLSTVGLHLLTSLLMWNAKWTNQILSF